MLCCEICKNDCLIPLKLICDHNFCFLCLKIILLNNENNECPICHSIVNFNILCVNPNLINFIWLYSSNCNSTWWCYDKSLNIKIENIYKDYLIRQQLLNVNNVNNDIKIKIMKTNKKENNTLKNSLIDTNEIFETIKMKITDSFVCVNFFFICFHNFYFNIVINIINI